MVFSIVNDFIKTNNRYRMTQHCVEFKLNNLNKFIENPEMELKRGFTAIYDDIVGNLSPDDKVGITFSADDLDGDFHIPFRFVQKIKFEDLWELLQKLYQSKKQAIEGDTFKIITTSFTPFRGSGRVHEQFLTFDEECSKRRGIITIKNKDNLCLARALVVAMAYVINVPYLKQVRQNIGKRQDQEAMQLIEKAGVNIPPEGAGIKEVQKFQEHLKDFKITIYEYGSKGRTVLYEGPQAKYKVNLLYYKHHYNVITSLTSAFVCRYFCTYCHVPYDHKDKHRCNQRCPCCQSENPCAKTANEIYCDECHRRFRNNDCFSRHKASTATGKSLCQRVRRCGECLKTIKANRRHLCNEYFCRICNTFQLQQQHLCYIQIDTSRPVLKDTLFVFYDLETRQDDRDARNNSVHVPVLCVFQQRCDECFNIDSRTIECFKCGLRRQIIRSGDIVKTFIEHLFQVSRKFKSTIIIAHNGQSFDHIFILKYIMENTSLKPDVIMRGSKVLMMSVFRMKFIDSLNYFPMKLAALPKAFGVTELKKGYFPHLFNTVANKDYIGPLPDSKFYAPNRMKSEERVKFFEWYNLNKNKMFDLQRELIEYCISDVEILTTAAATFQNSFLAKGNVSPFTEAITIPGACNKLFRRNFLKPDTIGIIPKNGYRMADIQSRAALQWLIYEEEKRGIIIRHAARGREAIVNGVKVDGYNEQAKEVYEFNGCYFHGCPKCFAYMDRDEPTREDSADTLNSRYERTLKKKERLERFGYKVVSIWEHEFEDILNKNADLKKHLNLHPLLVNIPLNPRDAFYGGRTGCTKSYYKIKPGEKIKYVDVCSLYPYVCKYGKFPIGHPKVHIGEACKLLDLQRTEGLIKCKILPPQDLYHPVLPTKMNNKLMFVLCRTCGEEMNQSTCSHTEEERCLYGTYVMDEIRTALDHGYVLLEIFEVMEYQVVQYDPETKSGGLFKDMMDTFIKTKQEASGWPSGCNTVTEKNAYIEEFFEKEGILLEYVNIASNPALRSLSKLILNSFWGKFGQRENQSKTTIVNSPSEFCRLEQDPSVNINHVTFINEDVLLVSWDHKQEAYEELKTINVVIASFVTAQARLKLYSYLEKLEERVLYYDTDSIIYISREGEWDVPVGNSLGEMTNELEEYGIDSYIIEFISAGPKNYSYIIFCPQNNEYRQVCKVKGFCLDYKTSESINFNVMKKMILRENEEPVQITTTLIRCMPRRNIVTKEQTKIYQPCLTKRKFDKFDSVPYGFKKSKID